MPKGKELERILKPFGMDLENIKKREKVGQKGKERGMDKEGIKGEREEREQKGKILKTDGNRERVQKIGGGLDYKMVNKRINGKKDGVEGIGKVENFKPTGIKTDGIKGTDFQPESGSHSGSHSPFLSESLETFLNTSPYRKLLKKLVEELKISTPIELALIRPKGYRDLNLYPTLLPTAQLVRVKLLSYHPYSKVIKFRAFFENLQLIGYLTFFKLPEWYKKLLLSAYQKGEKLYLWGEVEDGEMIQPQIIRKIGFIEPIYPSLPISINSFKKILKELIREENLYPLPPSIATLLYRSHFPENSEDILLSKLEYVYKWTEIFNYLYQLRKRRKKYPAPQSFRSPEGFIHSLPFPLTGDQRRTIFQIHKDLQKPIQQRRVVIGDVGSGKTIVMLATAFMAEKSAIMCPTSVLAEQIYREGMRFLTPLGFKTVLVTQKSNVSDREIEEGNLLIGTHALLYRKLPPLKAVLVDEQHRFGVAQRRKLEELVSSYPLRPHHFQFSATPIPRTQALIQSNSVEVSLIKELPFKKEIETTILPKNWDGVWKLLSHLKREIGEGRQGIIVYPAVDGESRRASLERGVRFWKKYFPSLFVTHGKDKKKEEILEKFRKQGSLLLTTTIVEVGLSLPKLSTIAIIGAEQFGLATLHQLRGRVGRYGNKGYCFLITDKPESKRLQLFADTLDGFKIAELDLKFRRAGDILDGNSQSGRNFRYFNETTDSFILEKVQNYLDRLEGTFIK